MNSSHAESVRRSFREYVRRNTGMDPPLTLLETTLVRGGAYCGRRFSALGYSVIWFIDEQQVKLYGQDGSLLKSQSLQEFCAMNHETESQSWQRRAA